MSRPVFSRVALAGAAALASAGALLEAPPLMAQEAAEANTQEVVVTGSRIRRDPVEETAPLQTQTAVDIQRTGEVSLGDFLQRMPIAGSAINRSNNSSGNLGFPPDGGGIGAGASEIDLRYLGSRRVLVLVDGRRWIRGASASGVSGAVDLNTIPTAAIDRIEVLQDGASPIYGSDAIGGVVNIITKKSFDGFNASVNQGMFDESDGYTQDYNLSWGGSSEGSRAFLSLGYARQDAVFSKDRDISSVVHPGAPFGFGGSGGTVQGLFSFNDPTGAVDADGNPIVLDLALNTGAVNDIGHLASFDPNNPTGGDFHAFSNADRFNFRPFNYLTTPSRRVNVFGKAERDITDDILLSFTGSYTNRESANQAAPNPLFMGSDAGSGFYLDNILIPANQPYNPFGVDLNGRDNLVTIGRRPLEAGPRIFDQNVDTFLLTGAVSGKQEIVDKAVFWDVSFTWGRNNASQIGHNIFNARKLALALGDPADCAAVPGCVPFNIFGGQGADGSGSITPEMLQWATFTQHDSSQQELNDIAANLSGELFPLPAGALGYALGFEHRKESGSFEPDAAVQGGETADVPAQGTAGEVLVNEVYLELNVPVLAELPFAKRVELSAAVRSSDYDRFGRDEVYKGGLYWRMSTDFSVRFNYAQGFRAPNIGELFNGGSRFDSNISDPCSGYAGSGNPSLAAACQALGVPASYTQVNQQISVQTGGNVNLDPEKSNTWTAGFAYSPSWAGDLPFIENLTFDFNYYDIELKGAIQALNAEDQLNGCVATLDPTFCNGIVRGGGGGIIAFANQVTNIGRVETEGFDFAVTAASKDTGFGVFRFSWGNTYLGGYKEFTPGPDGLIQTERAGTEIGSPTKGLVRWKSTLTTDWEISTFTPSLVVRYVSGLHETCPGTFIRGGVGYLCSDPDNGINDLGSRFYVDSSVGWTPPILDDKLNVGIGVNNLLDKDPPLCRSCDLNSYDGTIYPIPGRFFYARASVKF